MDNTMSGTQRVTLKELLQQSQLLHSHQKPSDLPQIHLGLDQIENQSRKLVPRTLRGGQQGDMRAHYFLANGGIDASELTDTINNTNIANAFEPLQPLFDTDVDSYLRHEHEQTILSAIEEGRRETLQDFQNSLQRTMHKDWERQKRKILEELGQHQGTRAERRDVGSRSRGYGQAEADLSKSASAQGSQSLQMHGRIMRYNSVVQTLNERRLQGRNFPLAHAFLEAVTSIAASDARSAPLIECWHALAYIVGERDIAGGEFRNTPVRERQYARSYFDPAVYHGPEGSELRKSIVHGSKAFLETQFLQFVDTTIAANPVRAQLGGAPSIQHRIAAFLRVYHQDRDGRWAPELDITKTKDGPCPIWACIFYLLRTGHEADAYRFAADHEAHFRLDPSFVTTFQAWIESPDHRLSQAHRDRFLTEYNSRFRNIGENSDPYKHALYKLIGRIDVTKKYPSLLTRSTENWLWLQLCSVREVEAGSLDGEAVRDHYTLATLARKLVNYGEAHFDPKGNRPFHYFQILLLSGQFERAIAFLSSRLNLQVDAVQFAVALEYYGLLRVAAASSASQLDHLTITTTSHGVEVASFDFAKLIQRYTRTFGQFDAPDALQYLYLVALNKDAPSPIGEEQVHKCHDLIRALVLGTKQYAELLGDIRNDGSKVPGLIERNLRLIDLSDEREYLSNIVRAAAVQSEAEHRPKDAILLFNLAEEYDTVVGILNKVLSIGLTDPIAAPISGASGDSAMELASFSLSAAQDVAQLARSILDSYERQNHIIRRVSLRNRQTCKILLELKAAFNLYSAGELEKTLQIIESLDLVPLQGDVITITRKAEEFKDVDENIARNFSEVLLMTMTTLYKIHQSLKESPFGDTSRQQRMVDVQMKARALMTWAGMLRFRMSSEVYSQLTRLDVFIH